MRGRILLTSIPEYLQLERGNLFANKQTQVFLSSSSETPLHPYADIPRPRRDKSERKPFPTPMKLLIRRAKLQKEARKAHPCRMLPHPPQNGLLVPDLVPVAHRVYRAHALLISGLAKLVQVIPVQRCRFCCEVHIGHVGHEIRTCDGPGSGTRNATHAWRNGGLRSVVFFPQCFHLYDRVGKPRVGHDERHQVPRIPAIVELCIQAGVDLEKYPAKRRTKPVYSIEGRIVDFEQVVEKDETMGSLDSHIGESLARQLDEVERNSRGEGSGDKLCGSNNEVTDIRELSITTMESWFEMTRGAKKMMEQYSVWTCGYCPEVHVGPKGHRVRMCRATKHQVRDGQHAWQEATIDDLVGPNYVWHVRDLDGPPLNNKLKRYYGKAPAVVELCVQAGAPVPNQYRSMMRLDVVPPDPDEVDLVA